LTAGGRFTHDQYPTTYFHLHLEKRDKELNTGSILLMVNAKFTEQISYLITTLSQIDTQARGGIVNIDSGSRAHAHRRRLRPAGRNAARAAGLGRRADGREKRQRLPGVGQETKVTTHRESLLASPSNEEKAGGLPGNRVGYFRRVTVTGVPA
jgi:hypothetical protein